MSFLIKRAAILLLSAAISLITGCADFKAKAGVLSAVFVSPSAASGSSSSTIAPVTVNPGILITETGGSTIVTEGGNEDSYSIVLLSQPSGTVTVQLSYNSPTPQIYLNGSSAGTLNLTFTTSNWNIPQSVTVKAIDDNLSENGQHTAIIMHTVNSTDPDYNGIPVHPVTVYINDNDSASIVFLETGGSTNITEGADTDSFSVYLTTAPSANVTVTLTFNSARMTLNGNGSGTLNLTFTPSNYHSPQTVTVAAVDDAIQQGPQNLHVTWTSSSGDTQFNSLNGSVNVSLTDNDSPAVIVSQTGGATEVTEGGSNDTLDIKLTTMPSSNVTVRLYFDSAQIRLNGSASSPLELTFTPSNFATVQSVTVSAYDDTNVEGNHTSAVSFAVLSSDPNYNSFSIPPVTVYITDNDISPLASGGVVSGEITMTATTRNITLTSADMSKSFVICYFRTNSSNPSRTPACQLTADDNLRIESGETNAIVRYYRVTFASGIKVQRGQVSFAAGDTSKTAALITAVDLTKAFIIAYTRTATTAHAQDGRRLVSAAFTDNQNLIFERSESGSTAVTEWQVVELDGAKVHSGITTVTAGNLTGTGITSPLNMNATFVLYTLRASGTGGEERAYHISSAVTSTSEVTFSRKNSTGSLNIAWFAVEMQNGTKVIRGKSWDYTSGTATSFSRDTTDSTHAWNNQSYIQERSVPFCSHSVTGTDASDLDSASLTPKLDADGKTLTMERDSSQNVLGTIEWYIMELNSN